jgi:hypothetical protein
MHNHMQTGNEKKDILYLTLLYVWLHISGLPTVDAYVQVCTVEVLHVLAYLCM